MPGEPNYYEILGIEPTADAAAIEAAYKSRSLKFRVGLFDDRPRAINGPTQEEIERAYAVLSDPERRAQYDLEYFPAAAHAAATAQQAPERRRKRLLGAVAILCLVGIAVVLALALTVRGPRQDATAGRAAVGGATATATATAEATATSAATATATAAPPTATAPAAALVVPVTPAATAPPAPSPTAAPSPTPAPSPTAPPTVAPTPPPAPTATATAPTATPTPTPAAPAFVPTDVVGTDLPVNFREGPGTGYAILGTLPKGTPLAATGQTATVNGVLWRQFALEDGAVGWMRDMDVLPAR